MGRPSTFARLYICHILHELLVTVNIEANIGVGFTSIFVFRSQDICGVTTFIFANRLKNVYECKTPFIFDFR